MNKLSREKRNQLIGVAAGVAVLCGVLWYFVVRSLNENLAKTRVSVEDVQSKIEKAQRLIKRRAAIEEELSGLTNLMAQAEAEMIPVEQLNGKKWLLDKLNRFTKDRYDVTLMSLSNDPVIGKQFLLLPKFDYSGAAYNVEVRAFFHEYGKFLADFEKSFPYIRIQNLQIWPLATPLAATGPTADVPEELMNTEAREQLRISMRIVILFKPAGPS